ncbi:MAG: phosphatase PAP2 family protein [Luteolibacter sp.]
MSEPPPTSSRSLFQSWRSRPLIPVLILVVLGALGGFLHMASEIRELETRPFDESLLMAMREPGDTADPIGPPWVEEMARDLTALGGFTVLTLVTLTSFGVALLARRQRLAWFGVASVVAGSLLTGILKNGYDRPRPDLVEHSVRVVNPSFPSGHSTMSAVVYLTLGILLDRTQRQTRAQVFAVSVAVTLTVLVGCSRVYLGVHWPTDVVAGWLLGGAWAVLFWLVAMKVDPRPPPP